MARKIFISLFLIMMLIVSITESRTEAKVFGIQAQGQYTMGDSDSREVAKEKAIRDAKRSAVEKAGTYVESFTKMQNCEVTQDEIKVIAAGITRMIDERVEYITSDSNWICKAYIVAEVDTSNIDLKEIMRHKEMMRPYPSLLPSKGPNEIVPSISSLRPVKPVYSNSSNYSSNSEYTGVLFIVDNPHYTKMTINDRVGGANGEPNFYSALSLSDDRINEIASSEDMLIAGTQRNQYSGDNPLEIHVIRVEHYSDYKKFVIDLDDLNKIKRLNNKTGILKNMAVDVVCDKQTNTRRKNNYYGNTPKYTGLKLVEVNNMSRASMIHSSGFQIRTESGEILYSKEMFPKNTWDALSLGTCDGAGGYRSGNLPLKIEVIGYPPYGSGEHYLVISDEDGERLKQANAVTHFLERRAVDEVRIKQ